jgi:hypothetical protein
MKVAVVNSATALAVFLATIAATAQQPTPATSTPAQHSNTKTCFQGLKATQFPDGDIKISVLDLTQKYHWDGQEVLWRLNKTFAGMTTANGSLHILSMDAVNEDSGIPFGWGSNAKTFGQLCLGNIEVVGEAKFLKDGLLLTKGSHLNYPKK